MWLNFVLDNVEFTLTYSFFCPCLNYAELFFQCALLRKSGIGVVNDNPTPVHHATGADWLVHQFVIKHVRGRVADAFQGLACQIDSAGCRFSDKSDHTLAKPFDEAKGTILLST